MVFQVTVYTEDDGSITLSMDDMDLAVNAPSKEESIKTLCRDMVEYAGGIPQRVCRVFRSA